MKEWWSLENACLMDAATLRVGKRRPSAQNDLLQRMRKLGASEKTPW